MAGESWMVERAKEELRKLEAEHPNRLDFLKLELKVFISESIDNSFPNTFSQTPSDSSFSVTTQESSNRKRKSGTGIEKVGVGFGNRKDKADIAIERAEACLRKIRRIKESLAHG